MKKTETADNRDRSKLLFNGVRYGKGRLVLAVVTKYVNDHPRVSYVELKKKFPDELHSLGIVQPVRKARDLSSPGHKRFFLDSEAVIKLQDKVVAVCSDFGANNIAKFLERTAELGYRVRA